ncbi:hypothetical protein FPQ18DRAFT_91365 [Pyronema domesticum]|nr:hypothetical protein FPQ18DRAFT_91365 [Pyronema domesticum]
MKLKEDYCSKKARFQRVADVVLWGDIGLRSTRFVRFVRFVRSSDPPSPLQPALFYGTDVEEVQWASTTYVAVEGICKCAWQVRGGGGGGGAGAGRQQTEGEKKHRREDLRRRRSQRGFCIAYGGFCIAYGGFCTAYEAFVDLDFGCVDSGGRLHTLNAGLEISTA